MYKIRSLSYGTRLHQVRFDKWDLTKRKRNYGLASDPNHFCMPDAISGIKSLIAGKYEKAKSNLLPGYICQNLIGISEKGIKDERQC